MPLEGLKVDVSVVLGKTRMPLHRFLRLGRGAVVSLDGSPEDLVEILASGHPIARGRVAVRDGRMAVEVTELVRREEVTRQHGTTIGGGATGSSPAAEAQAAA